MFKVLLIVYLVGGGRGDDYTFTTNFVFQEFNSMVDCETTIETMKELNGDWHYGSNKKNVIPAHYSAKCVEMVATGQAQIRSQEPPPESTETVPDPTPPPEIKLNPHERWDR